MSKPTTNITLAKITAELVREVGIQRPLVFVHVAAHTGIAGNEWADTLADKGAHGFTQGLLFSKRGSWFPKADLVFKKKLSFNVPFPII